MAQALVRIEYVDVPYQAALEPAVELFNDYFYGGMAGIVFQEIREARALAYSVGALYFNGRDKADYNYMVGGMGTQADKTARSGYGLRRPARRHSLLARALYRRPAFSTQQVPHGTARLSLGAGGCAWLGAQGADRRPTLLAL